MTNFNFFNYCSSLFGSGNKDLTYDCRLTVGSPSGRYCSSLLKLITVLVLVLTLGVGNVWGASATWALVTSAPSDWSGEYLIVYSSNCFDGSLTSGFNGNAGQSVNISSNKITKDDSYSLTVSKVSSKYYLQTASGYYIGRSANSNGVDASTTRGDSYEVTFSSWNGTNKTVKIAGTGGRCLGNNSGSWKFFSSSNTYVNVSLYKKEVSAFTITAQSNNNSYGTVSLSGSVITATPASGYQISSSTPYTVTSGTATVSQSGNAFTVTPTSNCTVCINFESKGCTDHYGDNVASGTEYSNKYGPVATYYKYSTRQILYTRADLNLAAGKKGTIKSIYFNAYSNAITARKIKIYMANTSLATLNTSNYVPYSDFTQVFASNSWTCSSGWNEIELTTPFEYSGRGNLVVLIDDNSGEYHSSEYFRYHTATTTTGAQIWTGDDNTNENPSSTDWSTYTPINYRPRTKFCIQEADMKLAKVTLMDNSATLTEESLGAGVTLPSRAGCTGYTFAGWTKSWTSAQSSWTATAPTIIPAGSYIPAAEDENLYPVYTTTGEGTADVTIIPDTYTNKGTNNYGSGTERTGTVGTINFGAHYVTGNSAGTPTSSSTGQFLQCQGNNATIYNKTAFPGKITQVVLNQNGATAFSLYCGTSQLMASNNTSTGQTPSGTAQTAQSAATKMTWTVSGNNTYFALKKGSSAGYVSSIVITYSATTTYYMSEASCCTALGSINGSFFEAKFLKRLFLLSESLFGPFGALGTDTKKFSYLHYVNVHSPEFQCPAHYGI